ncbi:MAG TPA: Gfo/Idh/MocA family oxidoreductase [Chloroflexota bacterium]|nr:Gfo/Idh/MocA family oxidoreductase [Chloroflexota bacterium]
MRDVCAMLSGERAGASTEQQQGGRMMADRIRWGILSTARIGLTRFIPGAAAARNGVVAAIASRDHARAQEAAASLGIERAYGSYEELLADPEVDAIYNPLPNGMHGEWTLKAAEAGKPVLCEKPLARDAAEAQAMVDGCRRHGVLLMEAFMYRFQPQHARVRALIAEGAIGQVRTVRATNTFLMDPINPRNVRLQGSLAGGALMDTGCYTVNAARMLFGEEPQWASAQYDYREDFGVDVTLAGVLGFSDQRMALIDCGFRGGRQGWYTVAGTRGQIDVPTAFTNVTPDTTIVITDDTGRREEHFPGVNQFTLEAEEFADALLQGRPVQTPAEDGVANMRVIDALYRSAAAQGLRMEVR